MYSGLLRLATKCDACGLDYSFADAGDAPAIIVMTIAGFIVLGAASISRSSISRPIGFIW